MQAWQRSFRPGISRFVALAAAVLGVSAAQPARADVSPADQAAAEVLFRDAHDLMAQNKDLDVACAKLAESQRLDPAPGTLLNLGDCEERRGRLASAYGAFLEAKVQAEREHDQKGRAAEAERRANLLKPKLPMLAIAVAPRGEVEGLEVKRDGRVVGKAIWGTGIPIDPGEHRVEATAPGRKAWSTTVQIEGKPGTTTITVPALALAPDAAQGGGNAGTTAASSEGAWSTQRTVGLVLGGAGVAGLVVGSVFGGITVSKTGASKEHCEADYSYCDQTGVDLQQGAATTAKVSDVGFVVGGAALVAGVIVFLTAPSGGAAKAKSGLRVEVGPSVGARSTGVSIYGRW